jgi:peptidoglycan-associated lipoprotein
MQPTHALRSAALVASLLASALACAHGQPQASADQAKTPAQPQLTAQESKPAAPALRDDSAAGKADLDAALARLRDVSVFFEFDAATLTSDAESRLAAVGEVLRQHPGLNVRVEGNCDERGSEAYNLALGQRRAEAARRYLQQMGAAPGQISAVSLGAEKPKVTGHSEEAWAQNRRDDVVVPR